MKIIFFILLILIPSINAYSLSASPEEITFNLKLDEELCKTIKINTEGEILLTDKWAESGVSERSLSLHYLNSEEAELEIIYPSYLNLKKETSTKICVSSNVSQNRHGVILIKMKNQNIGVGVWVNIIMEKSYSKIPLEEEKLENDLLYTKEKKKVIPMFLAISNLLSLGLISLLLILKNKTLKYV
jgi:hypothetical protein